jgi:hypothetical protein
VDRDGANAEARTATDATRHEVESFGAARQAPRSPGQLPLAIGLPDLTPLFAQRDELSRIVSGAASSSGLLIVLRDARVIEGFRLLALEASEAISRALIGPSMLSASLAAQMAEVRLAAMFKEIDVRSIGRAHTSKVARVDSIRRVAGLVDQQSALLAALRPQVHVARSAAFAIRAWDDVVRVSALQRGTRLLDRLEVAGRGTGWMVHAGLLLAQPADGRVEELELDAAVVLGPAEASSDLRKRLAEISPSLCERLNGAWERITSGGEDAASQAANSLMETVDWTLRILAPDADVLEWHASQNRSIKDLSGGRPTRGLRLRYVVRAHPEKNSALNLYLKALGELVRAVQAPKHAIELESPRTLVPVALSVEGLLHLLLVD